MNINDLVMPLESAEFVMKHAKSVQVNTAGVEMLAKKVTSYFIFLFVFYLSFFQN